MLNVTLTLTTLNGETAMLNCFLAHVGHDHGAHHVLPMLAVAMFLTAVFAVRAMRRWLHNAERQAARRAGAK